MINLLPNETKKQLRAARTNTILIKYIITVLIAAAFLGLAFFVSYYIMNDSKITAENAITNVTASDTSYSPITTESNNFISNLSSAKSILGQQISYSTIIEKLLNALPAGVVLESPFSISNDTIKSPITFKAYAKASNNETTLKTNLQATSVFSGYSLQSIGNNPDTSSNYPYLITFSITIDGATR